EADDSLAKHKAIELDNERLLKAVVSQDVINIVQKEFVVDTSDLQTYNTPFVSQDVMNIVQKESVVDTSDLQTELEHLQTELERTKERFENCIIKKETECTKLWNDWYKKCNECKYDKNSYDKAYKDMQQKIERLQAQLGDLKGKCKDTSCVSDTQNQLSQKLENANMELEFQPHVIAKKDVNSDLNGLSSIGVDNTKTIRPQPRSNTNNDRVPSASKSSRSKNKEAKVEEHHRNLLLSKNNKHISLACNNSQIDSQDVISKVFCAMCKKF
nr:hypothetical protein [Tanacetum cinerariifolium]